MVCPYHTKGISRIGECAYLCKKFKNIKRKTDMKKVLSILMAISLSVASASAVTAQNDGVITVKTSKAGRALVEKWVEAYRTVHPEVQIEVVSGKAKNADLTLVNAPVEGENVTWVGRYALLPVTASTNPLKEDIERKTWSAKDLKRLFFVDEELDDEEIDGTKSKKEKLADQLTVYTGSHSTSWTPALAAYFGHTKDDVKGNKVAGDDFYRVSSVRTSPCCRSTSRRNRRRLWSRAIWTKPSRCWRVRRLMPSLWKTSVLYMRRSTRTSTSSWSGC